MSKIDQDESVRLWNVQTGVCVLVFAGAGGHRNEVLSVVSILCIEFNCPISIFCLFLSLCVARSCRFGILVPVTYFGYCRTFIHPTYTELPVVAWTILWRYGRWRVSFLNRFIIFVYLDLMKVNLTIFAYVACIRVRVRALVRIRVRDTTNSNIWDPGTAYI